MDVVLVDEHEALRDGLEVLLERRGIRTVGTAASVAEAIEVFRVVRPDVAIVGLKLRDGSGLRLVRALRLDQPELGILIYTGIDDCRTLSEALESGARGFVLKPGGIGQLVDAVRQVARGERYVDPAISALLEAGVDGRKLLLTKRERDVFDLLARGMTGDEIALRMTLTASTVRTHIRNGMDKLHAHTRTGAVVQALQTHEIGS
jgi:DNA-binding NarL/FixJ family response regulator